MSGILSGFFTGSKWSEDRTDKQKMEQRIKDSVLNLVLDRDQVFLDEARGMNTSIIVNDRSGGIQEFEHNDRRYISFPAEMEKEFDGLNEDDAEIKLDELLKASLTKANFDGVEDQAGMDSVCNSKCTNYEDRTGTKLALEDTMMKDGTFKDNPFEYRAAKKDDDDKKDAEEGESGSGNSGCQLTSKGMEESSAGFADTNVMVEGTAKDREYTFEDVDLNVGAACPTEAKDNRFYSDDYKDINKHREAQLKALANQIAKSFKGRISRNKTATPSKRFSIKALFNESNERIYINKKGEAGKFLNINLIIDMSGSMDGTPVNNAVEMIYIFNEIAQQGYLKGNVLWSESHTSCKASFPMPREMIRGMTRTGGGEGLGRNLEKNVKMLKEADTNICMTDGQLAEDPILKSIYAKEKVEMIGVYVNKNAKDLAEYTGSLNRWFTRSIVRNSTEELCEKLVQFSLRKKK